MKKLNEIRIWWRETHILDVTHGNRHWNFITETNSSYTIALAEVSAGNSCGNLLSEIKKSLKRVCNILIQSIQNETNIRMR